MQPTNPNQSILAFDIGEKRIGVARAHLSALFPAPLTTLESPDSFIDDILRLCEKEDAAFVVLGLPRGVQGQTTHQTESVEKFGALLSEKLTIPLYWMDEALTSAKAEAELNRRGKPYAKGEVDALAATYILEDYIKEHLPVRHG